MVAVVQPVKSIMETNKGEALRNIVIPLTVVINIGNLHLCWLEFVYLARKNGGAAWPEFK
ncbi:hypothetical protein JOH50_006668 [Rhizobium leguminosarum]|nr:hypothetical protein [Rhizobium leguminosarum]